MPNNLDQIASGTSENVQIAGMRALAERLLHLQRQSVHAAPHIGAADRQPDPDARGYGDHRRSSTSSTSRSAEALTPFPVRTRQPPTSSISLCSFARAGALARGRSGVTFPG